MKLLLSNPLLVLFLSFFVGTAVVRWTQGSAFYEWLSRRSVFSGLGTYEAIGIRPFKTLLVKSPLRKFNEHIWMTSREPAKLEVLQQSMVGSEVAHWSGCLFMAIVSIGAWFVTNNVWVMLFYVLLNGFGNVYPALLQQYNKKRLQRVLGEIR